VACHIESTGVGLAERARLALAGDGTATLCIGTIPSGQGHETMAAQVVADRLGWPLERIAVVAGDTSQAAFSITTGGSRSAIEVGNAAAAAGRQLRESLLERAADLLEAGPADIEVGPEGAGVRGAPGCSVELARVVGPGGLEAVGTFDSALERAYSSGCHVARVAVDLETGEVRLVSYVIAHDSGLLINPLTADGQLLGGWVHGLGHALYEDARYAPAGEFRAATFLDYLIPSAPEVPLAPALLHLSTRSSHNPEGIRGIGESGTIPVPAAIASAVEDALRPAGREVRMAGVPILPETIALGSRGRLEAVP
jgi:aerobic carbon-monoxide dehydrogenase large subunit